MHAINKKFQLAKIYSIPVDFDCFCRTRISSFLGIGLHNDCISAADILHNSTRHPFILNSLRSSSSLILDLLFLNSWKEAKYNFSLKQLSTMIGIVNQLTIFLFTNLFRWTFLAMIQRKISTVLTDQTKPQFDDDWAKIWICDVYHAGGSTLLQNIDPSEANVWLCMENHHLDE